MAGDYVSLRHIIERLNRVKLPEQEFNISDIKEWCYQALRRIGIKQQSIATDEVIEIIDSVGKLPSNYETVIDVYEYESGYCLMPLNPNDYFKTMSYKIQSGYIYTDFEEGKVYLHYYALAIDSEGLPLIPNTEYNISAVEAFLRFKLGEQLYWQRKIVAQEKIFPICETNLHSYAVTLHQNTESGTKYMSVNCFTFKISDR